MAETNTSDVSAVVNDGNKLSVATVEGSRKQLSDDDVEAGVGDAVVDDAVVNDDETGSLIVGSASTGNVDMVAASRDDEGIGEQEKLDGASTESTVTKLSDKNNLRATTMTTDQSGDAENMECDNHVHVDDAMRTNVDGTTALETNERHDCDEIVPSPSATVDNFEEGARICNDDADESRDHSAETENVGAPAETAAMESLAMSISARESATTPASAAPTAACEVGLAETTRPDPRSSTGVWGNVSSAWKQKTISDNETPTDLRSIMKEQETERNQKQKEMDDLEMNELEEMRVVELAQEEEMVRLAMELSLSEIQFSMHSAGNENNSNNNSMSMSQSAHSANDPPVSSHQSCSNISCASHDQQPQQQEPSSQVDQKFHKDVERTEKFIESPHTTARMSMSARQLLPNPRRVGGRMDTTSSFRRSSSTRSPLLGRGGGGLNSGLASCLVPPMLQQAGNQPGTPAPLNLPARSLSPKSTPGSIPPSPINVGLHQQPTATKLPGASASVPSVSASSSSPRVSGLSTPVSPPSPRRRHSSSGIEKREAFVAIARSHLSPVEAELVEEALLHAGMEERHTAAFARRGSCGDVSVAAAAAAAAASSHNFPPHSRSRESLSRDSRDIAFGAEVNEGQRNINRRSKSMRSGMTSASPVARSPVTPRPIASTRTTGVFLTTPRGEEQLSPLDLSEAAKHLSPQELKEIQKALLGQDDSSLPPPTPQTHADSSSNNEEAGTPPHAAVASMPPPPVEPALSPKELADIEKALATSADDHGKDKASLENGVAKSITAMDDEVRPNVALDAANAAATISDGKESVSLSPKASAAVAKKGSIDSALLSGYDLAGATEHLSEEELIRIQEALKTEESKDPDATAVASAAASHGLDSKPTARDTSDNGVQPLSQADSEAITKALREADEEQERKSIELALQIIREDDCRQSTRQPQGNVRTITRSEFNDEQRRREPEKQRQQHSEGGFIGAIHEVGPPIMRHPLDEVEEERAATAGFRMNSSMQQQWTRRDHNTIVGPNGAVATKHDTDIHARTNAHRLGLDTDTPGSSSRVGNSAYNSFMQSVRRHQKKGVASHGVGRAGSDSDATKGGAMDPNVRVEISRAINNGHIEKCNGVVKEGKEAVIYHADGGEDSASFDVAIKVFKRIQEFRNRADYVDGDPRYLGSSFRRAGTREQQEIWAEKEFRNLMRAHRAGVPVPVPLFQKENVLFMRFLGTDGWPAPQLREINLRRGSSRWSTLYSQVLSSVKKLYNAARLVHGDLSEYNILVAPSYLVENKADSGDDDQDDVHAILIDFGQAVDTRHGEAKNLLQRDLERILSFFTRQNVETVSLSEAMNFVTEDP